MFRIVAITSAFALVLMAQANALEPVSGQPCMVRVCVETGWEINMDWAPNGQAGNATTVEKCTKWADRVNSKCMQTLSNGITLPRPRGMQAVPVQ